MIRAISIDAAFANMGLAAISITPLLLPDPEMAMEVLDLKLISTAAEGGKQVRKSSDDLRRAQELHKALHGFIREHDAQMIFAEIPSGAQSAAAAKYLGAALGILASVPIPIIQVSPLESRRIVSGAKSAPVSKAKVIAWAAKLWPDAPWVRYAKAGRMVGKGKKLMASWKAGDLQNCNEHLADALATAAAGLQTPAFQQLMALSHATTSTPRSRPALRRISLD